MVYWTFIFQKGRKKLQSQENNLFGDIMRADVNESAALKTVLAVTVKPGEAYLPLESINEFTIRELNPLL